MPYVRPCIKRNFRKIDVETPFNIGFVNALKYVIPHIDRSYVGNGVWSIDPRFYAAAKEIVEHYFGSAYTDATGGVAEPQVMSWKERWGVFKETNSEPPPKKSGWEGQKASPAEKSKTRGALDTLYVVDGAPTEVITASWRALNAMLRKDDPSGTKNVEQLARINGAYQELKKQGKV